MNALLSSAVETRPKMRRACLNRIDSTLDLLWNKPTDNCGSFTHYNLYGRDNALSLYEFLGNYTNWNSNSISLKLRNLKSWEFYLVYHKACNGTDSIFSDTIKIDNQAPFDSQLDSVSVDLATQKTILGWSQNLSPDIRGYYVYFITATNSIITTTSNNFYLDNGLRDPQNGPVQYGIAAFDSCNNTSLISVPHTTIHLQSIYNQCNKTINLQWTPYIGWPVDGYDIFLRINAGNFAQIGSVIANINQFTYNFSNFGSSYCFYVRAKKLASSITSSSNLSCQNTNGIVATRGSYIAKASVQGSIVELSLVIPNGTSVQKVNIYRAESSSPFSLWQSVNTNGGTIDLIDNGVNVHSKTYSYYYTSEGPCNLIFDTSQIAKTILLNLVMVNPGDQYLSWNLYDRFIKLSENQQVLLSNSPDYNKSSPWNILSTISNSTINYQDNTTLGTNQQQLCYCIRAIENNANITFNRKDTSYSNIECVTADPIVYFPNAMQINGFNTVFYPKGVFIDFTKSSFFIYDRWGQIVYETTDIQKGWDGKINDEFVQSDVYAYKAIITGLNGKVLYFDGTLTVLK
jgi:gliding motility-associated-like protein